MGNEMGCLVECIKAILFQVPNFQGALAEIGNTFYNKIKSEMISIGQQLSTFEFL
jgi:hypothetical protein